MGWALLHVALFAAAFVGAYLLAEHWSNRK